MGQAEQHAPRAVSVARLRRSTLGVQDTNTLTRGQVETLDVDSRVERPEEVDAHQ